jgi:multiple sugar transport system permease protein
MIILYAALRSIPSDLYEAAAVDGAGAVRIAVHIKLPLLRPALRRPSCATCSWGPR